MRSAGLLIAATSLLLASVAVAQPPAAPTVPPNGPTDPAREAPVDPGYDRDSRRADAVNAVESPRVATLNQASKAAWNERSAAQQAQYDADRAAYLDALVKHDRAVDRRDARYARQQAAYADAIFAWREQAEACRRGKRAACDAPAPTFEQFY